VNAPEVEARELDKRSGSGIVAAAEKEKGLPYVWGGGGCKGPSKGGFDCSGMDW
jgi:cell wall-associated NlpC family hydrolase